MADFIKKLRNKQPNGPMTPDEDLSPEELAVRKNAQSFQQKYGDQSPEEEGAHEEGYLETAENFANQGVKPEEHGMAKQVISVGPLEKEAESAGSSILRNLRKLMPEKKLVDMGNDIRLTGQAHVFDEGGQLVRTIGHNSEEGQALKSLAKQNLANDNEAAKTFNYKQLQMEKPSGK